MITLTQAVSWCGETFVVATADPAAPIPLRLDNVTESTAAGEYSQFSLLFSGPKEAPLAQQTYLLTPPHTEQIPIFLVPVANTGQEIHYQAIFSYPRS